MTAELTVQIESLAILKPRQYMAVNASGRHITNIKIDMKTVNINVESPNNDDKTGIMLLRAL